MLIFILNGNFKERRTLNSSHPLELGSDVNHRPSKPQRPQNVMIHESSLKIGRLKIVKVLFVGMLV